MSKTLKDYIFEGGIKDRKFIIEGEKKLYEVKKLYGSHIIAMDVVVRPIPEGAPGIKGTFYLNSHLNDKEYTPNSPC